MCSWSEGKEIWYEIGSLPKAILTGKKEDGAAGEDNPQGSSIATA